MKNTVRILGYPISNLDLKNVVFTVWQKLHQGNHSPFYLACANPHSLVVASKDNKFKRSLFSASFLLPDGIGILLAARILGLKIKGRVAGNEFFLSFSKLADRERGIRYYFLGSTQEVLEKIVARAKKDFPNIEICGTYSPPFKPSFSEEDDNAMINAINSAKPDVLWVSMTAPKQEKWILKNKDKLNVKFIAAIGAVFDFYAGTIKRAPRWACHLGLEWLLRFFHEPRRLWRRNFISTPLFLKAVFKQKLSNRSRPPLTHNRIRYDRR